MKKARARVAAALALPKAKSPGRGCARTARARVDFVVDGHFLEALGLDPEDANWQAIDWDWVRPKVPIARRRLSPTRLDALREVP